jgi:NADH:ubiquinone oxidoreductase subunit 2 (subunit N)
MRLRPSHRLLLVGLIVTFIAIVLAIFIVAWLGDGNVASVVDYNIPATYTETVLESISALLTGVFVVAFLLDYVTRWHPAKFVSILSLAAGLAVGMVIFWIANNLFWLLVDLILLAITLYGVVDMAETEERRHRRRRR